MLLYAPVRHYRVILSACAFSGPPAELSRARLDARGASGRLQGRRHRAADRRARLHTHHHRRPVLQFQAGNARHGGLAVLRLHALPRHLPGAHGESGRRAAAAAHGGIPPREGGVRHRGPGARYSGIPARLARQLRPHLRGPARLPRRRQPDSGRFPHAGHRVREAAGRRVRRGARRPGHRGDRRFSAVFYPFGIRQEDWLHDLPKLVAAVPSARGAD